MTYAEGLDLMYPIYVVTAIVFLLFLLWLAYATIIKPWLRG